MSPELTVGTGQAPSVDLPGGVEGAVDIFDAAARLESNGVGDAIAGQRGFTDVFALAATVALGDRVDEGRPALGGPGSLAQAWYRSAVLLAGVLVCLPLLPQGGLAPLFLAASFGWLTAQVASAGLWWGLGRQQLARGGRLALACALPMIALTTAVGTGTGWWELPLWALWGVTAAVSNTLWTTLRWALVALAGGFVSIAPLLFGVDAWWRQAPAIVLTLVAGCLALGRLAALAAAGSGRVRGGLALVGWSLYTALALQALLLCLMVLEGGRFAIIALAGVFAGIVTEPVLEMATQQARLTAASVTSWGRARRRIVVGGLVTVLLVGVAALVAAGSVAIVMFERSMTGAEAASAFLLGALTGAVGVLMRCGSATGAAAAATGGAAVVLVGSPWMLSQPALYTVLLLGFSVVVALRAGRRLASPAAW